jgi:hypothetical protein
LCLSIDLYVQMEKFKFDLNLTRITVWGFMEIYVKTYIYIHTHTHMLYIYINKYIYLYICIYHIYICIYTYMIIFCWIILGMRNVSDKFAEKIKTRVLSSIKFFFFNRSLYETVYKNIVELAYSLYMLDN